MSEVGRFRLIGDVLWIGAVMSGLSKSEIDDLRKALTKWFPIVEGVSETISAIGLDNVVLTLDETGYIQTGNLARDGGEDGQEIVWIGEDNNIMWHKVTHWMPLPEPPEELI